MRSELPTLIALAAALAGCALAGGDAATAEVETLELASSLHRWELIASARQAGDPRAAPGSTTPASGSRASDAEHAAPAARRRELGVSRRPGEPAGEATAGRRLRATSTPA